VIIVHGNISDVGLFLKRKDLVPCHTTLQSKLIAVLLFESVS